MTDNDKRSPGLWVGAPLHFGGLAVLLIATWFAWTKIGSPQPFFFWLAVASPIMHQVFVWLAWRLELRSGTVTKSIGFQAYQVLFYILILSRIATILPLAWLDRGTLGLPPILRIALTIILIVPWCYLGYSIRRYFGFTRATGADHFDPRYRSIPLVRKGIFRWTNNGMYIFGFLIFWAIATGFDSSAALIVAAFSHAYIWIHYYSTEKPDMDYLYGDS